MALLLCRFGMSGAPIVCERYRVGESGGVDMVLRGSGRLYVFSGTDSLDPFPSLSPVLDDSDICGLSFLMDAIFEAASVFVGVELLRRGNVKRGRLAILNTACAPAGKKAM